MSEEIGQGAGAVLRRVRGMLRSFLSESVPAAAAPVASVAPAAPPAAAPAAPAAPAVLGGPVVRSTAVASAPALAEAEAPKTRPVQELLREGFLRLEAQGQVLLEERLRRREKRLYQHRVLLPEEQRQSLLGSWGQEVPKNTAQQTAASAAESGAEAEVLVAPRIPQKLYRETQGDYQLPSLALLLPAPPCAGVEQEWLEQCRAQVQHTLDAFRIDALVSAVTVGPRIVRVNVRPAPGVKVQELERLEDNFAMELQAVSIRILAPVPGKPFVGIEVPSPSPAPVFLRDVLEEAASELRGMKLGVALGRDGDGCAVVMDLARAPHLLVAGATGSGKSVCINAIMGSLLMQHGPDDLQLILVDPKMVELSAYAGLPHLITPLVTDAGNVAGILRWVAWEMKRRYAVLAQVGARNIEAFNARPPPSGQELDKDGNIIPRRYPRMVVVIDELADIMLCAGKEVEASLASIAQLSRAVGIHTVVATQRPSVDVLTGVIKANYPTRIAFKVSSMTDAMVILGQKGAEALLGRGDMLVVPPGAAAPQRLQGVMVSDPEIEALVAYTATQAEQNFDNLLAREIGEAATKPALTQVQTAPDPAGDLLKQAFDIVLAERKTSISYVQRRLKVGYNKAATLIEELEQRGVLGPAQRNGQREILRDSLGED